MPDSDLTSAQARQDIRGGLPEGTVLGTYELKSIIGKGAFGITYRAHDLTLGRDVAIKEYLPTSLALREGRTTVMPISTDHAEQFAWGRERFIEEARTLTRLEGTPAIVRAHDFLEANGTAYMVMGLIEGENLNKRLMRERRLEPEAVERLLFPLLDGLEAVHGIGFLHRDIKPANIMIDSHGLPTLIDFGAARAAMAGRSTTMTAIFTPGYAAAEQYTSTGLGPWTDIYGLSATFYHAITGKTPPSSIDRILNDAYEPLGDLMPDGYDPAVLAGIDAGMIVRVDDRPRSIAEWRQMLRSSSQGATRVARKPGPLARVARRTSKARLTIRGPALWGALAAAVVVVTGAGYLALTYNAPTTIDTAALNLSAEQLEQALAERRKADALASEKRRLEEEARQKAEADAAAKRQADEELEKARQARVKAEQEVAELKASIEARRQAGPDQRDQAAAAQRAAEEAAQRKAEADAAALRQAEEEAAKKAEADAEAKRQADQALAMAEAQRKQAEADAQAKADVEAAARRQASEEAQRKAEAEAAARRQADEVQAKAQAERDKAEAEAKIKAEAAAAAKIKEEAEAAEKALRLDRPDRERLQVALTSLGFDTRGNDGIFGPRTREMIAAWQKARKDPPTGFLTAAQQQAMTKDAAAALAKHDEQKKAEDEARTRPVVATAGAVDGKWRGTFECRTHTTGPGRPFTVDVEVALSNGAGSWYSLTPSYANNFTRQIDVSVEGSNVTVRARRTVDQTTPDPSLSARLVGNVIQGNDGNCSVSLTRDAPAAGAKPAPSAGPLPDGTYTGALQLDWTALTRFSVQFKNGIGIGTITRAACGSRPISIRVGRSGDVTGEGGLFSHTCVFSPVSITGRVDGGRLLLGMVTALGGGGDMRREFVLAWGGGEAADTAQPTSTGYDGTYAGETSVSPGFVGASVRFTASAHIAKGRGTITLTSRGCEPSRFSITVSLTGIIAGEGMLNCIAGASITGPMTVSGEQHTQVGRLRLNFQSERGGFQMTLSPTSGASSALPSPDGLWRGTYSCGAAIGSSISEAPAFTLNFDIQLVNGSGVWKSPDTDVGNGRTLEIKVSAGSGGVSIIRSHSGTNFHASNQGYLTGQYDGGGIHAAGRESSGLRDCTVSLRRS